jgi:hypothetical protein
VRLSALTACTNTVRGLHYQVPQHPQGKLVRSFRGVMFDAVVDVRHSSDIFGRWPEVLLGEEDTQSSWIPTGFDAMTHDGVLTTVAELDERMGHTFARVDIRDADLMDEVVPNHDFVVHFDAESPIDRSISGPTAFLKTGIANAGVLFDAGSNHLIPSSPTSAAGGRRRRHSQPVSERLRYWTSCERAPP